VIAFLQLPAWLGGSLAMLAAIALGVLPVIAVRRVLPDDVPAKAGQIAETVAGRSGAVHALILALVFAEAQSAHADLRQEVSKEISAIEHLALHLAQWNAPEEDGLRTQLAAYVRAVMESEWRARAGPSGSPEVKRAYDALDLDLLDLKADTPRQQSLRTRMIGDMEDLQDHRKARLSLLHRGLPGLFWWVALAGFVITVGLFFVFPPTRLTGALLSVYGAYTGLVLYLILALSHPYVGPAAIDPAPYAAVLSELGTP
jgi:hypothetical protein